MSPDLVVKVLSESSDKTPWIVDKVLDPIIIGASLALVGSWLLPRANERFKGRRDHLSNAIDALLEELANLQALSAEYWASSASSASKAGVRAGVKEAEIEFHLQQINSLLEVIRHDLWPNDPLRAQVLFAPLAAQVSDADFGTAKRPAKPDKGRTIASIAADITFQVHQHRRRYFSENPWFL